MDVLHAVSGLLVGALVGLTGVGGGSLMAPILILIIGVAPATAVGTDLWFAAITKAVGAPSIIAMVIPTGRSCAALHGAAFRQQSSR